MYSFLYILKYQWCMIFIINDTIICIPTATEQHFLLWLQRFDFVISKCYSIITQNSFNLFLSNKLPTVCYFSKKKSYRFCVCAYDVAYHFHVGLSCSIQLAWFWDPRWLFSCQSDRLSSCVENVSLSGGKSVEQWNICNIMQNEGRRNIKHILLLRFMYCN